MKKTALIACLLVGACAQTDFAALESLTMPPDGYAGALGTAYKRQSLSLHGLGYDHAADILAEKARHGSLGLVDPLESIGGARTSFVDAKPMDDGFVDHQLKFPGTNRPDHPNVRFEQDDRFVPEPEREVALETRLRLITLFAKGARRLYESEAAKAQAAFDCWILLAEDEGGADCKNAAQAEIENLEAKIGGNLVLGQTGIGNAPSCQDPKVIRRYHIASREDWDVFKSETVDRFAFEAQAGLACRQ